MNATTAAYATDDFSVEAEQYRYEHGGRVLNRRKVTRRFYNGDGSAKERCIIWHAVYGDTHAETRGGKCSDCGAIEADYTAEVTVTVEKFAGRR